MNVTITEVIFSTMIMLILYLLSLEYKSPSSAVMGMAIGITEVAHLVSQGSKADVIIQWGFNASSNTFSSQSIDGQVVAVIMSLLSVYALLIIKGIGKGKVDI